MLTPKINPDFNATVTYKRATIGPEGTIKQVALTQYAQAPTSEEQKVLETPWTSTTSPLHVIACSDQFTHASEVRQLSHRCLTDEDILVTVTTADGVYAHTYNRTQWQEEEIDEHTTRAVLPLSVIRAKLVVQADNTRTVLDDLIAAKSKKIALELDDNYTLRNDFTVQIEYYGVYEDGDADYTCLYDLYGFNTSSNNVSYNTICLCDGNETTPTILALRFFGYGITLPALATDGFSLFVKVFETSKAVNVIELDKPYVSDYSKHLEDATANITTEHKKLLDTSGRAGSADYEAWESLSVQKVVTGSAGSYSTTQPQVQVYDSNDDQERTYGVSTRYAGPGYTYDAHIWYYWNETKIKEVLLDKFNLSLTSVSQSFVGFDSRTGSFLYTFVEAEGYNFIIISGSNNYHYVDIYQLDNASEISTLFKTELSGEGAAHQYRAKIFRWYGTLYLSDVAEGNVYYINPGPAEAPIPVWQDITKNNNINYLYHEIRVFKQCTITNASGDNHVYCTEFSDLGDVAIKYENGELSYVGMAPRENIDWYFYEAHDWYYALPQNGNMLQLVWNNNWQNPNVDFSNSSKRKTVNITIEKNGNSQGFIVSSNDWQSEADYEDHSKTNWIACRDDINAFIYTASELNSGNLGHGFELMSAYWTDYHCIGQVFFNSKKLPKDLYKLKMTISWDNNQSVTYDFTSLAQERKIDAPNAFQSVLNYYDVDYISQQNTLELMYRQSAYHIKYLVDHHYKIVYLGPKYSVGYDADNRMYLFLMKDFIHTDAPRRVRIGEDELDLKTVKIFDKSQGNYTLHYDMFIVYNDEQNTDVIIDCKKDDSLTLSINNQEYNNLTWRDASGSWVVSATDENNNSLSVLYPKTETPAGSNLEYTAGQTSFDSAKLKVYKNVSSTMQHLIDAGILSSNGQYIINLSADIEVQNFLSVLSDYNLLDADRGVFVIKSTVSGVDGYVRYLKGAQ